MEQQNSQNTRIEAVSKPQTWKVILAFGIVYLVWGSTFLAIRVGVREVPPFLLAGMRFLTAGTVLYAWTRFDGTPSPRLREWGAAALLGTLMFAISYGLLFWAERRVPSGIAAVMLAIIPVFMAMADVVILRARYPVLRLAVALLVGIAGVAELTSRSLSSREVPIDTPGACALIVAAISWSVAAALTRKLPLPASKRMSSGAQMLAGGILLTLVATLRGEFTDFQFKAVSRMAWLSLGYLICGRVDHRVHGISLAHPPRVTYQSGHLCIRESSGRCAARLSFGRGKHWTTRDPRHITYIGGRGGNHDYAGGRTPDCHMGP